MASCPLPISCKKFENDLTMHTLVHENLVKIFEVFPSRSHPMGQLMTALSALSSFYPESLNPNNKPEETNMTIIRLLAKMPTVAAMVMKRQGTSGTLPSEQIRLRHQLPIHDLR
jgi:citrate synthase